MRKPLLVVQMLIFIWMQLVSISMLAVEPISSPMPKNYRMPDMVLPDSVAFHMKYHNKIGQRVDVRGYEGRFGATFGDDFKQKIYEIEQQYNEKIKIILTLPSTMADAEILQKKLESHNHKMVIVEIPQWLENEILEKAGRLVEKQTNVTMPKKSGFKNAMKIIHNQYVKPTKQEVQIAAISATTAGIATATALTLAVGMDPLTVASLTLAKTLFVGTTAAFGRTLSNLSKADLNNELRVITGVRKVAADTYYTLTTNAAGSLGNYNISSALSDTVTTLTDQAVNTEKEKKLSETAKNKLFWYTFAFGAVMGMISAIGLDGPLVIDSQYFKITYLQSFSLLVSIGLYLSFKYRAAHIEKMVEKDLRVVAKLRNVKIESLRKVINPREKNRSPSKLSCTSLFN